MNINELDALRAKVLREMKKARVAGDPSSSLEASGTDSEGFIHKIVVPGLKNQERVRDEIDNVIHWVASLFEYLRMELIKKGLKEGDARRTLKRVVTGSPELSIVMDMAILKRHGEITHSKVPGKVGYTGRKPRLGNITLTIPLRPSTLTYTGTNPTMHPNALKAFKSDRELRIEIPDLGKIEISAPVVDASGSEICDALEALEKASAVWDIFLAANLEHS